MSERYTRRIRVFRCLMANAWVPTSRLCHPDVGGSEGTRRLRELRKQIREGQYPPYADIRKRKKDNSTQYEYALVRKGEKDHDHSRLQP